MAGEKKIVTLVNMKKRTFNGIKQGGHIDVGAEEVDVYKRAGFEEFTGETHIEAGQDNGVSAPNQAAGQPKTNNDDITEEVQEKIDGIAAMNKDEVIELLEDWNVEHKKSDTKDVLVALAQNHMKANPKTADDIVLDLD